MSEVAESTPTRVETVTANITAVEDTYGEENFLRVIATCVKDMSVSLAMLVDAESSSSAAESTPAASEVEGTVESGT